MEARRGPSRAILLAACIACSACAARGAGAVGAGLDLDEEAAALHARPASQDAALAASRSEGYKRLELAILEDYDKGEDLDVVERDFRTFAELGIRTWRGSFGWDDYEPERDRYDFAWLHAFVELAARHGLVLRPYLAYTPEWAAAGRTADGEVWNDPPARLADWRELVAALSASLQRHPNVASYEIYNEENVAMWWDGTAGEYDAVLAAAVAELRASSPSAEVVLGGMVWPDAGWLAAVCGGRTGGAFDVVAFHAYPETWTPPGVTVETYLGHDYEDLLATIDADCGPKRVWMNEIGFATVPGRDERAQARWWARSLATFAAAERVEQIGVYEIKDLAPGRPVIGDAPNYHLGLLRADRTRKLAFYTVRLFAEFFAEPFVVADAALTVRATRGDLDGLHRRLFRRPDGRQLAVLWTTHEAPLVVDLELAVPGAAAYTRALDGTAWRHGAFDGRRLQGLRVDPDDVRVIEVLP